MQSRWVIAMANAVDSSTPIAMRPAVRAASAAPIPPGTGTRPERTAADVFTRLGDAISGVDREAAYATGMKQRADIDQSRAQTDAAMELARQRRLEAEREELTKAALQRVQQRLESRAAGSAARFWDRAAAT